MHIHQVFFRFPCRTKLTNGICVRIGSTLAECKQAIFISQRLFAATLPLLLIKREHISAECRSQEDTMPIKRHQA